MNRIFFAVLASMVAWALPTFARAQVCIDFQQDTALLPNSQTCGEYTDPGNPGPLDAYDVQVVVDAGKVDQMRLYYSTGDASPSGQLGSGDSGTQVVVGEHSCEIYSEGNSDVFKATIPAMPKGTLVSFSLSAWKQGSEGTEAVEHFLGDGEAPCYCNDSSCAHVFTYTVGDGEPRPMPDEYLVAADTPRAFAAPALLANDRYLTLEGFQGTVPVAAADNLLGDFLMRDDGSFQYSPPPGFVGTETFSYTLQCNSQEYRSNPAEVRLVVKLPPALVSTTAVAAGQNGCPAGGRRIDTGLDNGVGGGEPLDGILQTGEITSTSYVCNGVEGSTALVSVSAEAAGSNCAKGGQKIESGVDANGNGVLDSGEVIATSYACNGAQGKSGGCSAAPGALSLMGALATLAWAGGATRRRRN